VSPLETALAEIVVAAVRAELEPLVDAIERRLAEPAGTRLNDVATECRRLGISRGTLARLRTEGLPTVRVGDAVRFRPADVDAWLAARGADR